MYIRVHACMYGWMDVCMCVYMCYICMDVCVHYVCVHACMYTCVIYVCMYVHMHYNMHVSFSKYLEQGEI